MAFRITAGNLGDPRVLDLVKTHLARGRAQTAPGSAHALDVAGLQRPAISLWTAWDDDEPLATGALRRISSDHGEVKSMYTAEHVRRRGVASTLLRHLIDEARRMGLARLSLETGSWDYFAPARALYARHGFVECGPFGDYELDPNSVFMTLDLPRS